MAEPSPLQMRIALVLREDLATWQRLNVAAFLSSAIASDHPESMGLPYRDAAGGEYPRMFALPVMVFEAPGDALQAILAAALEAQVRVMPFPEQLFATGNDEDNRAAFAALPPADMRPAGLALYGGRNRINKLLAGTRKHS
jgi:hypothetical protein